MSDKVYILLPTHNRRAIAEQFARCLAAQVHREFHLVLIDDGCSDGTADAILSILPSTTVLRGHGNWWWAGALQQGYVWLRRNASLDDVVLIINDDTSFGPDYLANAVASLRDRSGVLLHSYVYGEEGEFIEHGVHVDWASMRFVGVRDDGPVNCCSTRGVFLRVRDLFQVGGFHPILLPHYASDYEFTMRALRKGLVLESRSDVAIVMNESTTGLRDVVATGVADFLRKIFSKRAVPNPLYWSSFIVLACPLRHQPRNLAIIWKDFIRRLREAARTSMSGQSH